MKYEINLDNECSRISFKDLPSILIVKLVGGNSSSEDTDSSSSDKEGDRDEEREEDGEDENDESLFIDDTEEQDPRFTEFTESILEKDKKKSKKEKKKQKKKRRRSTVVSSSDSSTPRSDPEAERRRKKKKKKRKKRDEILMKLLERTHKSQPEESSEVKELLMKLGRAEVDRTSGGGKKYKEDPDIMFEIEDKERKIHIRDDGNQTISAKLRNMAAKNPNCESGTWFGEMDIITKPRKAESLFLHNLMPGYINPTTIWKFHDRSEAIPVKNFANDNSGMLGKLDKRTNITTGGDGDVMSYSTTTEMKEVTSVYNLMTAFHNKEGAEWKMRNYTWACLVVHRVLHDFHYFSGAVKGNKNLQKIVMESFINSVDHHNAVRARKKEAPMDYDEAYSEGKRILRANECYDEGSYTTGDCYTDSRSSNAKCSSCQNKIGGEKIETTRPPRGRGRDGGRGGRGGGRVGRTEERSSQSSRIYEMKKLLCYKFNNSVCDFEVCKREHKCSKYFTEQKTLCMRMHSAKDCPGPEG